MDESFTLWRNALPTKDEDSIVISDSDEDIVEASMKNRIYVFESSDGSGNVSRNLTPHQRKLSPIARSSLTETAIKRRIKTNLNNYVSNDFNHDYSPDSDNNNDDCISIEDAQESDSEPYNIPTMDRTSRIQKSGRRTKRKDISHDYTREGLKGLKLDSSGILANDTSDCSLNDENLHCKRQGTDTWTSQDEGEERKSIISIDSEDSAQSGRSSAEPEIAITLAKQEIGVGNIDPLVAQKRALLVCKMQQLQNEISKTQLLLSSGNMDMLPDKGAKLRESIVVQEKQLKELEQELEQTPLTQNSNIESHTLKEESCVKDKVTSILDNSYNKIDSAFFDMKDIPLKPKLSSETKELGKKAQATLDKELALTVDRLQDLHGSLVARPAEDQKADDPQGLKVKLMPHQQHALAWLLWREQQRPPGGVLADDMGLGKTLTMISLILASAVKESLESKVDSDDEWFDYKKSLRQQGGTLVVCPASLLSQWENEINNRCRRGMLSVQVYHGSNRENVPKRLANNDVVITTYNILTREFKVNATVYKIHWKRVILDEAHIIRNHKSQASQAVCGLFATKRWALTGTPIQNKEMDLYSILKFLQCTPFDDLRVWKRWVDNKNAAGRQRLATVMKTLMLRRTKEELLAKGAMDSLPEKCIEEVLVTLDSEEQLVYEKILIFSRTLFAQFLSQRAEKDHMAELGAGIFDKPTFRSNPNRNTQFTKAQNKLLSLHADVKTHEILVLLLRLRQVCCHPFLIHEMLDTEDMKENGIMDTENLDPDLLSHVNNISLCDDENERTNENDIGIDRRVTSNLLTSKNPVFEYQRVSSKMNAILNVVKEILQKKDKLIIVSQWTSMLDVVGDQLSSVKGATYSKFTGRVPIKERQGIMDSFNAVNSDPKVLLLSLTAGGVGLNLVGGNHLLLIDIHWNPQLETQAQDRIYRFGQKKNVYIYKFICKDTIEERIKQLQERKLEIAKNVLSGDKDSAASKLTLNDLKSLFAL